MSKDNTPKRHDIERQNIEQARYQMQKISSANYWSDKTSKASYWTRKRLGKVGISRHEPESRSHFSSIPDPDQNKENTSLNSAAAYGIYTPFTSHSILSFSQCPRIFEWGAKIAKIRLITKQCSVACSRHVVRISSRKGPTWCGPLPPTKNRKLLGFGPLFFVNPAILFSFF